MSLKIEADFTGISSSFEPLSDGTYRFELMEIQDQATNEDWTTKNAGTGKNPALVFVSEVVEGERHNAQFFDYIYIKTKDGKSSKAGLGKIKAYAEAILGKEEANSPHGIDLEAMIHGRFDGIIKSRKYQDKETKEEKTGTDLAKILPIQ